MGWGLEQQDRAGDSANHTNQDQGHEDAAADVEAFPVGASAGGGADPKCEAVGGVGRDRWDTGKEQRWERDKAASACDGVERAAEGSGDKEDDGGVRGQGRRCIRNGERMSAGWAWAVARCLATPGG